MYMYVCEYFRDCPLERYMYMESLYHGESMVLHLLLAAHSNVSSRMHVCL